MKFNLFIKYTVGGTVKTATNSNEDIRFEMQEKNGNNLIISLIPQAPIKVHEFFMRRAYPFGENARFMANGFQSWSDTKEFTKEEKMPGLGLIGKSPFGRYFGMKYVGDYSFVKPEKKAGTFHSHSFAYVRKGDTCEFVGSLNDRTGYTVIYADMHKNELRFAKDLEGIVIDKKYEVLNLLFTKGSYDEVFDCYFSALGITPPTPKGEKVKGYTSWYNYYKNISEDIILRDLNSLSALENYRDYVNIFQIDDGYQTAVGDWFSIDREKFPNGMKPLADAIHEKGLKAGLWLAPFGAQRVSKVAAEHPDWLVKGKNGKPILVGHNWSGFYALDIYNEGARNYIKSVFREVLDVWGFDLVKLDFLYAAAVMPMHGKTRGEIAFDSIDLLRECVGDKKIIGCGVQQMPCFGKVDYMRVGADMNLSWAHDFKRSHMHREDVSTPNAIHNVIYRRGICGRAFLCDPDVFLLRRTNIHFEPEQQKLLGKFIKLFGDVLFMSDNVAEYDANQLAAFQDILAGDACAVTAIDEQGSVLSIDYTEAGEAKQMKFDVWTGEIY
ncbi:MAG: alpha-galactosidase [Clostridia bacterium]|nr:alpha-galactosidase [Clostridia bacterium]